MHYNNKNKLRNKATVQRLDLVCAEYLYVLCLVWIVDRGGGEERVTTPGRKETILTGQEPRGQIEHRRQKEEKNKRTCRIGSRGAYSVSLCTGARKDGRSGLSVDSVSVIVWGPRPSRCTLPDSEAIILLSKG